MSSAPDQVEQMQKHFPKCPICESEKGYALSAFYPHVQCKLCRAEWLVFDDGLELKGTSKKGWDRELLHKKYPFKFWKELDRSKLPEPLITEKIFAPMDYLGGHIEYKERAIGYILLRPDSIWYKTSEGSLNKFDVEIPVEKFKGIEIRTGKEITFLRWFLIGAWSILFKEKKEYLVLTYEDSFGMLQRMVFDFHNQRKMVNELIDLVSYLKMKKARMNP